MSNKLTSMARDILSIENDLYYRLMSDSKSQLKINDFEIHTFEQSWGSTALGFGGIGGQAITSAYTYVLTPLECNQDCFVYFAGKFAYKVPYSSTFMKDVYDKNVESVAKSIKYRISEN